MTEKFKLNVFRRVADTGNCRWAPDKRPLTQAAVNAPIKPLEVILGSAWLDSVTSAGLTLTEQIVAAVEAGLGVGFVPCIALEKALTKSCKRLVPLDNGPIRCKPSIALLHGPEPKGPAGQLGRERRFVLRPETARTSPQQPLDRAILIRDWEVGVPC